jgi:hypothetical protein
MTEKKRSGSTSKRTDNLKLLFSMKEFSNYIDQTREKLKIHPVMYSDESSSNDKNSKCEIWYEKIMSEDETKLNLLSDSIKYIVKEYHLPENYTEAIRNYILFGTSSHVPVFPFNVKFQIDKNKRKTVELSIHEKLTDQDLKELKKYINEYFGQELPVFKPIKNIVAKIKAKEYIDNKVSYDYAEGVEHIMDAEEIVENVKLDTGVKLKRDEVYDIPRQLKKMADNKFKRRSGK